MIESANQKVLVLAGEEEEELVPDERDSYRESIVLKSGCGPGREGILLFEELVMVEVAGRAMKLVGAGLDGRFSACAS